MGRSHSQDRSLPHTRLYFSMVICHSSSSSSMFKSVAFTGTFYFLPLTSPPFLIITPLNEQSTGDYYSPSSSKSSSVYHPSIVSFMSFIVVVNVSFYHHHTVYSRIRYIEKKFSHTNCACERKLLLSIEFNWISLSQLNQDSILFLSNGSHTFTRSCE